MNWSFGPGKTIHLTYFWFPIKARFLLSKNSAEFFNEEIKIQTMLDEIS